jgi:hypothetical protein
MIQERIFGRVKLGFDFDPQRGYPVRIIAIKVIRKIDKSR